MLPPQAPPAHIALADTSQSAVNAIQRMGEIQQWIAGQQDALPAPTRDLDGQASWLALLDAFWEAPVEEAPGRPALPRRQAFALRLSQAVRDDAVLRGMDGTLSGDALETVRAVAAHPGGPLPGHLHARELLAGDVPYAGALVIQDDRRQGPTLLFTVEEGWTAFGSLDLLYRDVELRLRAQLVQRDELPGVSVNDLEKVLDSHFLDSRPIDGGIFDVLSRRLIERWRERVQAACRLADSGDELGERLSFALHLHPLLDVHGIVRSRDLALAARLEEERLAEQPAAVRDGWRHAATELRNVQRLTAGTLPPLDDFAEEALAAALTRHGVAATPSELYVRLTRRVPEQPLANLLSGFPSEDLSLRELAYRNLSAAETLQVIHPDGTPRDDVSPRVLRDIVRDLDLPHRYARHLDERFGDTAQGRARRDLVLALHQAAMRFAAADARLAYHAAAEPASFLPDRRERGFAWVTAVLDHPAPAGRARVEGHEILVRQLTYQGAPLTGVFLIAARQAAAVPRIVLYTPDAPDGLVFREFADRAELDRRFLRHRAFEGYLLDRLPAEFADTDANGRRRFKVTRLNGDRSLGWIFNTGPCQGCTELAEHFAEREVTGSFLDRALDDAIALAKRNAHHVARTTGAAHWQSAGDFALWASLPSLLLKEFVVGAVQSVPRTAQAAWRFYDHVKAGQGTDAFLAFVDGYTSALAVLPLYTQLPRLAGAQVRAAAGSPQLVPSQRALPPPDTLFEKRYLARGLAAPADEPASGVFALDGHRLIRQAGKLYYVTYDKAIQGWRLTYPGTLDSQFTGPAIHRLANGQWHFRRVGLPGGGDSAVQVGNCLHELTLMAEIVADPARLGPALQSLTQYQRSVVAARLRELLPFDEAHSVMRRMAAPTPPLAMHPTHTLAWHEALETGRRAPPTAPVPLLAPPQPPAPPPPSSPLPSSSIPAASTFDHIWKRSRVIRKDWPAEVYAYLPRDLLEQATSRGHVTLPQLQISGTDWGIPVITLPPGTPLSQVPTGVLPMLPRSVGASARSSIGDASGGWVRIHMHNLVSRHPMKPMVHPYRLYSVPGTDKTGYYLRSTTIGPEGLAVFDKDPVTLIGNEFHAELAPP